MRSLLLFILITLLPFMVSGQINEFSIQLSSGLFSFGGSSAESSTGIMLSYGAHLPSYTVNPYGKRSAFSYSFGFQAQRITVSHFIFGIETCYESLSSNVTLNYAPPSGLNFGDFVKVYDGKTILLIQFGKLLPLHWNSF